MFNKVNKNENRLARHKRVRKKISGTAERPRLSVYKSAKNIYAQLINDINRTTLVAASTIDKEIDLGGVAGLANVDQGNGIRYRDRAQAPLRLV